jgi:predicted cupin superfamily sugar epimerase
MNKKDLIESLQLAPHLEGGYFRRTYESTFSTGLTKAAKRPLMSSIYYLLTDDSPIGFFHRNRSDIVHYWHSGHSLTYLLIDPEGEFSKVVLGPNVTDGEELQLIVPGGYWKATLLAQGQYGLLSEAVAPGFEYEDMELASTEQMQQDYPKLWKDSSIQLSKFCKY